MKNYLLFAATGIILSACSNTGSNAGAFSSDQKDRIEITNDMENAKGVIPSWFGEDRVIVMNDPPAHSGTYACVTNDTIEYSYYFQEILQNIRGEIPKRAILSGWVYTTVPNPKFSIICSIEDNGKQYNWKAVPLESTLTEPGKWVEFSSEYYFDDKPLKPEMKIGLVAWNQSKKAVYIDDLKVIFLY
jgi:hypothetical protein